LRTKQPQQDIGTLCGLFGKSRQAYYQRLKYNYKEVLKAEILLQLIAGERELMPRIGGRKLLYKLQPRLPSELLMGRDKFFDFLREYKLLVRRKRYRVRTTNSNHWLRRYPNLVKEFTPSGPHQLWVSDITYIETAQGFVYLFLITDAYSRKVIGWSVGQSLEADHALLALYMALSQLPAGQKNVYHHSDRGVQYCSEKYVKILKKNGFQISMTENGDPLENALAERINGILKQEWLNDMKFKTKQEVADQVNRIINIYNNERPHSSIGMLTPVQAHKRNGELQRLWKNYYKAKEKEGSNNLKVKA
jgi:transposase InsO family protein